MKLVITFHARKRLKEIHDYYKEKANKKIADKIKSGIIVRLNHIEANPLSGQKEEYLHELNVEHRRVVKGNYKIIYRIINDVIYITDIFDSRQDPSKMNG